jgi:hypothetical protein
MRFQVGSTARRVFRRKEAWHLGCRVVRHSRVCRTFCFALLCDPLSFARPNESRQRKRRPGYASALRAEPLRYSARRVRPELGSLWRSSNRLAAPARCAGHPLALRFSFASHGAGIQHVTRSGAPLRLPTEIGSRGYVLVGLRRRLIRPPKAVTLSER